ncbi:MAG: fibronectin type III domain-containing protein, partial [Eubacterium sp.]|nr:fibronectin type III domain-containing protein [Eubacterium sp.]
DEIPALGHTPVTDPAVPATCTLAGSTEGVHCAVCEKVLKAKTDIPAAHKPVAVKAVAPTFKNTGKTAGKKCSACGKVITPQKTVAKLVSPSLKKVSKASKAFTAKWNKFNVDGYEIRYSLKKNMKKSTTVKVAKTKKSLKVKKLKSKKTYYVQIRGYKKVNGKTEYSAWSAKKKVTVK